MDPDELVDLFGLLPPSRTEVYRIDHATHDPSGALGLRSGGVLVRGPIPLEMRIGVHCEFVLGRIPPSNDHFNGAQMTIAIAIRTGSGVVFAADSKITTRGLAGIDGNGEPIWQEQTYDNATKVVHDRSKTLMAMVAGHANIGRTAATDLISTQVFNAADPSTDLDQKIDLLVQFMVSRKSDYWKTTQVPSEQWPGPTLLLAAPGPAEAPRVWRVDLEGEAAKKEEILTAPNIKLEGSYDEVFGLLHGIHGEVLNGMGIEMNVPADSLWKAWRDMKALRPYDKLQLWAMPVQDAIDMAVFLANVQVEMDRFLPGTPACGGPIDVMVLQMAPEPGILAYPGKIVHHPVTRRVN